MQGGRPLNFSSPSTARLDGGEYIQQVDSGGLWVDRVTTIHRGRVKNYNRIFCVPSH